MKHRSFAVVGVGVLAVAGLALTACKSTSASSSASSTPSATASASVAPDAALASAASALNGKGYDLTMTSDGVSGKGTVDPANKAVAFDLKGSEQGVNLEINLTDIGTDLWMKIDLGKLAAQAGIDPSKWLKVDATKVDNKTLGLDLSDPTDVLDIGKMTAAVSGAKRVDATHITGTIDLTKLTTVGPSADDLSKAGAAAKAVPFTATLDDQGRLSDLKIDGGAAQKGLSVDIAVSNIGSPSAVSAPPAGDVVDAPAAVYQILGAG